MSEEYADLEALRAYWPDLAATQEAAAKTRLSYASLLIESHAGGAVADDKLEAAEFVACDLVKRAMQAGEAPITQQSATAGPYSLSQTYANPMGKFYWDPEYDRLLGIGHVGIAIIGPMIGGVDG